MEWGSEHSNDTTTPARYINWFYWIQHVLVNLFPYMEMEME